MSAEQVKNAKTSPTPAVDSDAADKRERSTIQFPYNDMEDAVTLAKAIRDNAGVSCTLDQLAAFVKQSMTSGAFRLRLSTASTFGITQNERGEVTLTDLGRKIVDPSTDKEGKAEAFLQVPLYKAIFDKYRGFQLPPSAALEREMASLGVSSKQTDKARWAFMRSAKFAGFFAHGEDRLVKPTGTGKPETKPIEGNKNQKPLHSHSESGVGGGGANNGGGSGSGGSTGDPLLDALIQKLPKTGADWSADERIAWLNLMTMAFQLSYGAKESIKITKDS